MVKINEFEETQVVVDNLSGYPLSGIVKLNSEKIVITGPILKKNRRQHREVDQFYKNLSNVLRNPNFICRNRRDPEVLICYKKVKGARLRAAVWLAPRKKKGFHNSILSFRKYHQKELEMEKERGRVTYEKQ